MVTGTARGGVLREPLGRPAGETVVLPCCSAPLCRSWRFAGGVTSPPAGLASPGENDVDGTNFSGDFPGGRRDCARAQIDVDVDVRWARRMAGTPRTANVYNAPYSFVYQADGPTNQTWSYVSYHGGSGNLPLLVAPTPLRFGRRYGFSLIKILQPPAPPPNG